MLEVLLARAGEVLCISACAWCLVPLYAAVGVRLHHLTTEAECNASEWGDRVWKGGCSQAVLTYAFIPASLAYTTELWVIVQKCCPLLRNRFPNLDLLLVSLP